MSHNSRRIKSGDIGLQAQLLWEAEGKGWGGDDKFKDRVQASVSSRPA